MAAYVNKAVQDLYNSLSAALFPSSTRPPIFFGDVPTTDGSGNQVYPAYVEMEHLDTSPEYLSDVSGIETHDVSFKVFADSLASVDAIVLAMKWGGSQPGVKAGFDFGTITLADPYYLIHMVRTNDPRAYSGVGKTGQRTHQADMNYQIKLGLKSSY